jgi:membrane-associated phospholipid phosphatase
MSPAAYGLLYGPHSLNTKLFLLVNHATHPILDHAARALIQIGSSRAVYVYVAVLAILSFANRKRFPASYLYVFAFATLVGILLEEGLKGMFQVPRPAAALGLDHVRVLGELKLKNGLPSGHAVFAAVVATTQGWRRGWQWNVPLWLFAAAVCWSRLYAGAHYPLDVIVGTAVGAFSGFAVWTFWEGIVGKFGGKKKR